MLLPVGTALGTLAPAVATISAFAVAIPARPAELRPVALLAVIAGPRETRPITATAVVARLVVTRLVKIPRTIAWRTRVAITAVITLLPRLGLATRRPIAEILARPTIAPVGLIPAASVLSAPGKSIVVFTPCRRI